MLQQSFGQKQPLYFSDESLLTPKPWDDISTQTISLAHAHTQGSPRGW